MTLGSVWKASNDECKTVWKSIMLLDTSDEFKKLFIYNKEYDYNENNSNNDSNNSVGSNDIVVVNKRMIGKKVVVVKENLIEYKRVHNISIFLTKIKIRYSDLSMKINAFDDSSLSFDILQLLIHCLPTPNEVELIENYIKKNSIDSLSKLGIYICITFVRYIYCMLLSFSC